MTDRSDRSDLERRLREAEDRARLLFDRSPHPRWLYDPETLAILEVNEAAIQRYGYSRGELTSMTLADLRPEEDRTDLRAAVRGELPGRGEDRLWRHLTKDGEERWVEISSSAVELEGRPVRMAVVTDVTERRRAELELAESEARLRALLGALPDVLFVLRRDGTFEEVRGAEELLARNVEEVVGTTIADGPLPPEIRAEHMLLLEECLERQEIRELEYEIEVEGELRSFEGRLAPLDVERAVLLARDVTDRKRTEDRLQESRDRLETVLSQLPALVWTTDRDLQFTSGAGLAGRYAEGEEVLGRRLDEFLGSSDEVSEWVRCHEMALAGESVSYQAAWNDRHFSVHLEPLDQGGIPIGVIGVALDVTEERAAIRAREEAEERLREVVESSTNVFFAHDGEGSMTYLSPQVKEVFGYSPDEIEGRWTEFLTGHPANRIGEERTAAALETGEPQPPYELQFRDADGGAVWVEIREAPIVRNGEVVGMAGSMTDVTERKEAESRLDEARQRLEEIVTGVPAVFYVATPDDGAVDSYVSPQMESTFGWSPDDFMREPRYWKERIHPEDLDRLEERRSRLDDIEEDAVEYRFRHASGEWRWVRDEMRVVRDEEGGRKEIVGFMVDVTEEKQLEEQFRQSQKMEAVGRLAGGVAHDFNNLLTAIGGYADLALAEIPDGSPVRPDLEEIRRAAERAGSLTRQLLAFSRRQVLQPKVLDLDEVVRDVEKMLRRVIGEDVDLVTDLSPEGSWVRIDPGQLEQILMNLAVNARDAMPGGGRLTLATRNVQLGSSLERPEVTIPAGSWVVMKVEDSGTGMDDEVRERVFEPFFTTKEKGEGTGLGLSTVYGIVKQSDGFILVGSEPGGGTRFEIYLPEVEDGVTTENGTGEAANHGEGSERVLIVEDDPTVRGLMVSALRSRGHEVRAAEDLAEALSLAEEWGGFELLLSDLVLPDGRGPDLREAFEARGLDFATLYVSGYAEDEAISGRLEESSFLSKPFTPSRLLAAVRRVLDREEGEPGR